MLIAALALQSVLIGCKHTPRQTMTGIWSAVPQVRWSGRIDQLPTLEKSEPSVSANMAAVAIATPADSLKSDDANVSGIQRLTPATPDESVQPASGVEQSLVTLDSRKSVIDGVTGSTDNHGELDPSIAASPQVVFTDSSTDQIERLKAALNDDAEGARSSPWNSFGSHEVRVRVETMLEKARRLLDLGQLREARHTARIAQEIGDSARLDFSPEEERPADLVRRIEDQMKDGDLRDATATPPAGDSGAKPNAPTLTTGSPSARDRNANESESATRPRRDWSGYGLSVFRRDRKSNPVDSTVAANSVTNAKARIDQVGVVQLGLETDVESREESGSAIVQANRSTTLARTPSSPAIPSERDSFDASASFDDPNSPERDPDRQNSEPPMETPVANADENRQETALNPASWPRDAVNPPSRQLLDATSPPPTDFEEIKPISPFPDVSSQSLIEEPAPPLIAETRCAGWAIPICILAGAACTLTAVFWYRRGAT